MPIRIQPIELHQHDAAKRVILTVARGIYGWTEPQEEVIRRLEASGDLKDLTDFADYQPEQQGIFLVALDSDQVIGTGALRRGYRETAELRRLWLLEEYHGQSIGYRLMQALLDFARAQGYRYIRLLVDRRSLRAQGFYRRLGFQTVPCPADDPDDICMELTIEPKGATRNVHT